MNGFLSAFFLEDPILTGFLERKEPSLSVWVHLYVFFCRFCKGEQPSLLPVCFLAFLNKAALSKYDLLLKERICS